MNKLEAIIKLSKEKGFKNLLDECNHVKGDGFSCSRCSCCEVIGHIYCDVGTCGEQLLEEYIPPKKLTKQERAFCEYAQSGWLAREKNGAIRWFSGKPPKILDGWGSGIEKSIIMIDFNLFPFIEWEDEEPYSVDDLLTLDYEKE